MAGKFTSSTQAIPDVGKVPRHIAIIMDGNGRWAKQRFMPRVAGHKRGVETVRAMVKACIARGVNYLTLFAFSSENWRRPVEEVSFLMDLFVGALQSEIGRLHANGVRLKVVGDLSAFEPRLVALIREGEALTANNSRLTLTIAANYGGRWDILQAMPVGAGTPGGQRLACAPRTSTSLASELHLAMAYAPEPDLFIRTGGEQRHQQLPAVATSPTRELYFTDTFWPDFDDATAFGDCFLPPARTPFRSHQRTTGRQLTGRQHRLLPCRLQATMLKDRGFATALILVARCSVVILFALPPCGRRSSWSLAGTLHRRRSGMRRHSSASPGEAGPVARPAVHGADCRGCMAASCFARAGLLLSNLPQRAGRSR
jgi:undecaprenyl diphosphate synthase